MKRIGIGIVACLALLAITFLSSWSLAAEPEATKNATQPAAGAAEKAAADKPGEKKEDLQTIADKQRKIALDYDRLEQLLGKMATFEGQSNPRRAALLKQALTQSKDRLTLSQLKAIETHLAKSLLDKALEGQTTAEKDLKSLLELLQTENRADRLKSEQARIKEYIKEVERLLRLERGIQAQTEGGADAKQLAEEQGKVAERTNELAKRIQENEEGGAKSSSNDSKDSDGQQGDKKDGDKKDGDKKDGNKDDKDSKPGDQKPGDQKPGDQKPGDQKPGDQKPGDQKPGDQKPGDQKPGDQKPGDQKPGDQKPGDQKPGDQKPGDQKKSDQKPSDQKQGDQKPGDQKSGDPKSGKPQQGQPQQGQPKPGQGGDSDSQQKQQQQQQAQNPARQRIQAAEEKMREAERKLAEAKRKEAVEEQEKAKEELEKAKAALEEILRQMREEELERTLAMLEGRFKKMLEMQLDVYEKTKLRDRELRGMQSREEVAIRCSQLAGAERKIVYEADKALNLLREEGSSIAFPETVEQMREDMEQVAHRLDRTDPGTLTQNIEEEIIATLEELLEAIQKAQNDLEKKKQQQPPGQGQGQPQDQPLVDQIAELKMIKSLQLRVNSRTRRFAKLLDDEDDQVGQAPENDKDLREALAKLAEREANIQRITRDIVLGKNK